MTKTTIGHATNVIDCGPNKKGTGYERTRSDQRAIAEKGKFDSVYWIACGGSMIDLIPAHELLQREATTFTSYIYTAREFDIMRPRRLGEKSLVIACSHSGNTPEVVEAARLPLPPALR